MDSQTGPLWTGRVTWTHDEDSLEYVDVTALPLERDEPIVLFARNSSPTVDMVVNVGHIVTAVNTRGKTSWTCAGVALTDVITSTAHGFGAGDAVYCESTVSGLTANTVYYVVGPSNTVAHEADVGTNTFCLAAARGSDTVVDIDATDAFTLLPQPEFFCHTSFTVPKYAAATSTAPMAGLESRYISGWGKYGGQILVGKSAAAAGVCTCYLEIRRA